MPEDAIQVRNKFSKAAGGVEASIHDWLEGIPERARSYAIKELILKFYPVKDKLVEKMIDQGD